MVNFDVSLCYCGKIFIGDRTIENLFNSIAEPFHLFSNSITTSMVLLAIFSCSGVTVFKRETDVISNCSLIQVTKAKVRLTESSRLRFLESSALVRQSLRPSQPCLFSFATSCTP